VIVIKTNFFIVIVVWWDKYTKDWRLETGDWRLETRDWRLETRDWRLGTKSKAMHCGY
jgi:hypothetical protein